MPHRQAMTWLLDTLSLEAPTETLLETLGIIWLHGRYQWSSKETKRRIPMVYFDISVPICTKRTKPLTTYADNKHGKRLHEQSRFKIIMKRLLWSIVYFLFK